MMPRMALSPFASTTVGGISHHYYCFNSLLLHHQRQRSSLSLLLFSSSFTTTTTTTQSSSSAALLLLLQQLLPRQSRFKNGIEMHYQLKQQQHQQFREFSSQKVLSTKNAGRTKEEMKMIILGGGIRFASLLSKHLGLSRRQSERMILTERVTLFGKIITSPQFEIYPSNDPNQDGSKAVKVDGKLILGLETTLKLMYAEQQQQQQKQQQHDEMDVSNSSNSARTAVKNSNNKKEDYTSHQNDGLYSNTRIWLANKLKGELITEDDPVGRPSMLQRLSRGGVGKVNTNKQQQQQLNHQHHGAPTMPTTPIHLKPVGRLDMMTEGLMIFTNNGKYARELELPTNQFWRTYRVRVHGRLTLGKLRAMRKGITVRVNDNDALVGTRGDDKKKKLKKKMDGKSSEDAVVSSPGKLMRYGGIKVSVERKNLSSQGSGRDVGGGGTNTWLRITCTEGKNRQLRRILGAVGLDVTRLIRISYADYDLNTIPPGMAIEVPCKQLEGMKSKGALFSSGTQKKEKAVKKVDGAATVEWVNYT